ncbi:MAG: GMP reductase [Rhodobacteraceae bacterium]|nr:GMP reductase [Paracoccaceae bacterium]|tara:strand:+ start:1164 stop:2201 length:1038 start_codon:yes stop_codon:yes gene_type:complete
MRIESEIKLDFSDVLIKPKRSTLGSRKEVDLNRFYEFRNALDNASFMGVPIMASNMDGVGTFEMSDALIEQKLFTCLVKTYSAKQIIEYFTTGNALAKRCFVAMSIGIAEHDLEKLDQVMKLNVIKFLCIDVANGYSERFATTVEKIREKYSELIIIAGNVVTGEMTEELILSGADIVKVGIGPGSVCTTRIKTGVGYPQLSAIIECADAAHGLGGHIIADGGCSSSGDVAKAFGAGADFVMLGGMMAGHDEGGGEVIDGNVQFYGMSSDTANTKHFGGLKEYRSSEGRTVKIPYKGAVKDTVQDILGGIRSACTYAGARKIKDLSKCTTFVRVNNQYNKVFENN